MEGCVFTPENAETLANMLAVVLVGNVFIGSLVATFVFHVALSIWRAVDRRAYSKKEAA